MHTFATTEEKFTLLYCFIYLHSCQCDRSLWDSDDYGIERTSALRYLESECHKTDWKKAYPSILLYAPRVVAFAKRDCPVFVEKYAASDAEYLAQPQIIAILRMLNKMKAPPVEVSVPVLSKPPKTKKKK